MRISLLANDGSPLGVTMKTLWGVDNAIGVGGAEYAMLTMCEEWTKAGHEVILFNDPKEPGASPFEQRPVGAFDVNDPNRDVLIIFRSPNLRSIPVNNCLKVWWSCDQQTVGDFRAFSHTVDKIVCISPRHQEFFAQTYGISQAIYIDLPVRVADYDAYTFQNKPEKIPNRLLFTSVPARGLDNLVRLYPAIQRQVPDVSLVITSDYRLWGAGAGNEHFRVKWMSKGGVQYLGAVNRMRLIEEQLKSQITLYPSNYDELFCVSLAESQYAGSYPITSSTGSLPTTNMGTLIPGNGDSPQSDVLYVEETVKLLSDPENLAKMQYDVQVKARERFHPKVILDQWNEKVFK